MLSDVEAAVEEAEVAELLLSLPLCHAASSSLLPPVPSVHELAALRSAAGHVPLDAIADVLSAQPGRRMAIEDLNTVFGTSAPGASARTWLG